MSKKHFERFAIALALIADDETRANVRDVIEEVARDSNSRFDLYRFRQAVESLRNGERPHGFSAELFNRWASILHRAAEARAEVQP